MKEIPFHVTRQRERAKKKRAKSKKSKRKEEEAPRATRAREIIPNKIQIHEKEEETSNISLLPPAITRPNS